MLKPASAVIISVREAGSGTICPSTAIMAKSPPAVRDEPIDGRRVVVMADESVTNIKPSESRKLVWFRVAVNRAEENEAVPAN